MSELLFNLGGRVVPASEVARLTPPLKKPPRETLKRVSSRSDAEKSDGFRVVGFSRAQIAEAKLQRERDAALYADASQIDRQKLDLREPKPWDLEAYMDKAKPKRVRSKPYEIESAALLCAEMARKAGWLRVTVEELMKG